MDEPNACSRRLPLTHFLPAAPQTLHYVDAPHLLPLSQGHSVPMRSWWRHRGIADEDVREWAEGGKAL
jgi:hypothetical protein